MSGTSVPMAQNTGVGAAPQADIFGQSANAFTAGTQGLQYAANPMALSMTMNQFANPYRESVIQNALTRSQQNKLGDLNMVRSQAAQAGAFGGARQGLVESELMDRYDQNQNEMVSRLLQEGFTTQAQLANASLGQTSGASQALIGAAPTGFNMGQAALQGQQQAGQQQQALGQAILGQANQQYQGYVNYPQTALGTALAGLQGNPLAAAQTQTSQYNAGLFDYLRLGGGVWAAGK